jgi:iron complex outermembrane receptor protein
MKIRDIRSILLGSVTLGMLPHFGQAVAQDVTSPAPAAQDESQRGIDVIVVTAERRSENLQDTPIAVTALPMEEMQSANIQTSQDLMRVVPGLQVSTQTAGDNGGSATFFLRGMGQQRSGNGSEPAVGIYVDDLYYPSLSGSVFSIVDLQQVEVLRGPQGTLFGRNTIGGAIRYTTQKPGREFGGALSATAGSNKRVDATGSINIPLGDMAAVRLTGGRLYSDGFVEQANGGGDAGDTVNELARVALRVEPLDTVTIDAAYQQTRFRLDGFAYSQPSTYAGRPGGATGVWNTTYAPPRSLPLFDNRWQLSCDFCQPGTGRREASETHNKSGSLEVSWDITDNLTAKSLTGWQDVRSTRTTDLDGTPLQIADFAGASTVEALSQEFQLSSTAFEDRLTWVGGVFLYREDSWEGQLPGVLSTRIGALVPRSAHNNRQTESIAAFVDGAFELTDQLSVFGGLRQSQDQKDVEAENAITGAIIDTESGSWDSTTGRLGIRFRWSDDIMTYGSVSTGFRGGGFNFTSNSYFNFQPEEATNYEAGARMEFLDNTIRFNPTIFYTDWTNIQVQQVIPIATGSAIVLQNAAAATAWGIELEGIWQVTPDFEISGNLSTLDIGYDDIGAATGITIDSPLQRTPELTYSITPRYTIWLPNDMSLDLTANYSWQDEQWSTPTDSDRVLLTAYGLLGARIDLNVSDAWTLSVFGTNLTDEVYAVGGIDFFGAGVGTRRFDLGRPREYGATIRHRF